MLESAAPDVKEGVISTKDSLGGHDPAGSGSTECCAHLVVLRGPGLGDFYVLSGEETLTLGSDPFKADLVVRDIEVEPRHARIGREPDTGAYAVRSLGTAEEVAVNGETLPYRERRPLCDGDRIFVGDSVLEFSEGDPVKARFHEALDDIINRDHLTGLLAKKRFDEEFEHSVEVATARDLPLGVIMADIDNLKKINDRHGHLMGEFIVGAVGRIIGELHADDGRRATRFGGDEYQAILPGLTKEETQEVARELCRRVEECAFENDGSAADPTVSVGLAAYPEDGASRRELTRAADEALYRAKRGGGNTVSG